MWRWVPVIIAKSDGGAVSPFVAMLASLAIFDDAPVSSFLAVSSKVSSFLAMLAIVAIFDDVGPHRCIWRGRPPSLFLAIGSGFFSVTLPGLVTEV